MCPLGRRLLGAWVWMENYSTKIVYNEENDHHLVERDSLPDVWYNALGALTKFQIYRMCEGHQMNSLKHFIHFTQEIATLFIGVFIVKTWWRHQMETFPRHWPFVKGLHRPSMDFPEKGQWSGVLMFSLMCAWTKGWANKRDVYDSRRLRAHYDVTVMKTWSKCVHYVQLHG